MSHRLALLCILLVSAVLRLYGLNNVSPPGLEHDEVAHWLINQDILAGHHAIYFTEAYGHEAGFHYLQAGFSYLTGDNALTLRLPAAYCGLLVVAITYALGRKLFGKEVGLLAMGLTAVLFYPVFYSRLSLRAISLPVFSGLSAYFWFQASGFRVRVSGSPTCNLPLATCNFFLAGLFAGLSLHTYMAARAAPIFYALFVGYLALFHLKTLKQQWRGLAWFWLVFGVVGAPLVVYLLTNPGAEFRIGEVDAPLRALQAGDWRPILQNALQIVAWPGFVGDPLWRQGVAGLPLFTPVVAALFYGGVGWSLWNWRNGRFAFILLWAATAVIPSLVTVDAPSSIRIINSLPVLSLFPAVLIHRFRNLSTVYPYLSTVFAKLYPVLLIVLFFTDGGRTVQALFVRWPQNPEVQFVWQAALTEAAIYLDAETADSSPVAVGGWSPATMDEPTMQLTLRRQDLSLRYFGSDSMTEPINTLILPASQSASRLIRPTIRALAPALEAQLAVWGGVPQNMGHFVLYELAFPPTITPQVAADVVFAEQLHLLGYSTVADGVVTFWVVTAVPDAPRRFFVHALDGDGQIIAQSDSLDAPAQFWQVGDLLVQYHELGVATAVSLRLGVYNPDSCPACQNLETADGQPYILLKNE